MEHSQENELRNANERDKVVLSPITGNLTLSTAFDKTSAKAEANRRFARLAVAWFGIDAIQVDAVLRAVESRQQEGVPVDFLDTLHDAHIINDEQRHSLRFDHAPTQMFVETAMVAADGTPKWLLANGVNGQATNGASDEPTMIGHYRILRRLGRGGMGAVYLAFDSRQNRPVAVKVLSAEQAPNQNILKRFQREGQHGALLIHPNIVRTFDMGQDAASGLLYIVLEFVDGPSAHEFLDRLGKMSVGDAVHITLDIARALEHAHKNQIIHRDIKPANILLTSSGLAKLTDLGLAKRRDDPANLTLTSQGIGTPYYMPYEQAMNAKMADERSDIYALGATLYHLLTGEVPFPGESSLEIVEKKGIGVYPPARSIHPDIPERLEEILAKMLARDPEDRYQTASEVIVDLERAQLASAIPSYISLDTALQDPVVVERLAAPIEKTQADMNVKRDMEEKLAKGRVLWFLRYRDQRGNLCKAKGTAGEICERLKKGTIPTDAEAARSPKGPFKSIENWSDFGRAIAGHKNGKKVEPRKEMAAETLGQTTVAAPAKRWQPLWWILAGVLGVGVVAVLGISAFLYWVST